MCKIHLVVTEQCWGSGNACCLCGGPLDSGTGPSLVAVDVRRPVCFACGMKHAPALVALLTAAREREEQQRTASQAAIARRLAELAAKPLRRLVQLDGFADVGGDCVIHADADGRAVMGGETFEFQSGDYPARLYVSPGSDRADVLALLGKMRAWIAEGTGPVGEKTEVYQSTAPPAELLREAAKLAEEGDRRCMAPDEDGLPF